MQMKNSRIQSCCGNKKGLTRCLDAQFFRALCDPCRLKLFAYVAQAKKPLTVSQAAKACPTDLSVVSRHLATLKEVGILTSEKIGKEVYYSARYEAIAKLFRQLADSIDRCCPEGKLHRKSKRKGT